MPEKPERIKGGYYIKARCLRDSWIAHSAPVVRETWDYLLREANHKERKYNGHTIKRGQLFRTYREIRESLSWMIGYYKKTYSVDQMKHAMKLLTKHKMITLTNTPRGIIITVCNYEYYQNPKNYESPTEHTNHPPTNPPTIHQASPTSNKNVKNYKNEKKEPKTLCGGNKKTESFQEYFDIIWPHYPRKDEKKNALKAYQVRIREGTKPDELLTAAKNYAKAVKGKEKRFIKMAKTFFGPNEVWKDYMNSEKPKVVNVSEERQNCFGYLNQDLETFHITENQHGEYWNLLAEVSTTQELEAWKENYYKRD